ncbi:MAG: Fic family protein [Candidatus Margulisbacteria bacterium]|nr:Fic family protein [Candidatus Margulisiibacteriota bacterium]MBU1616285.1 Fic family protein [Candidatus Margulisiibacteriota bacterium]
MYKPNYKITPIITRQIAEISSARETILNSPLLPKIEIRLKKDALISRSHHSTSIEGNRLSKEEVAAIVSGRKVEARPRDKREVSNYISALKFIDKHGRHIQLFTPAVILKLHNLITRIVLAKDQAGHYRDKMVYVVDSFGRTVFTPPKEHTVSDLVKALCAWLNSQEANDLYPVLTAGIAHYELVRIHPFIDGNGRVARALATLILYQSGFDIKDFFALDDYYNEDRQSYYSALQSVDPGKIEITQWLEYFIAGVAQQMSFIKAKVQSFSRDRFLIKKIGQLWLNERQWQFIEHLQEQKRATIKDYLSLVKEEKVAARTARLDIEFLVKHKIVKRIGKGPQTGYSLAI